jgi:hypothetical protein
MKGLKTVFVLLSTVVAAPCAIVYFDGPSFGIPDSPISQSLELNRHYDTDFLFVDEIRTNYVVRDPVGLVPGDVENSYYIGARGPGEVMVPPATAKPVGATLPVQLSMFGTLIGDPRPPAQFPPPHAWDVRALLAEHCTSLGNGLICFPAWSGPLGYEGIGYIGIRFQARDGWHYGWIRARLPITAASGTETGMVIVDWAYESQPEVPIQAGMTGTRGGSSQFVLQFANLPQSGPAFPAPGYGSFILTGQTLRYELKMGDPSLADICAVNHLPNQLIAHLDQPFAVVWPPTYFGEVNLSHPQIAALLRGDFAVTDAGGIVIGRIVPVHSNRDRH